jgi:iron(III) transport system permease protein
MTSSAIGDAGEPGAARPLIDIDRSSVNRLFSRENLIPWGTTLLLVYLTVMPLTVLLRSSLQVQVAPGEFQFSLENFANVFAEGATYSTALNSAIFATGSTLLSFAIATILAWIVARTDAPFTKLFVPLAVVPLILPGVLEAIAWIFLLTPGSGYVNVVLQNVFGLESSPFDIYTMPGLIWVQGLGSISLAFLLMMAAFTSMDPSLEEASATSGAGRWRTARTVTLPLMRPAALSVILILFVRALEATETPLLIGLPGDIRVYTSEIFVAYREFPPDYGRAAALSVILLALAAVGVMLYVRALRNRAAYQVVSGKAFRPRKILLGRWRWPAGAFLVGYVFIVVVMPLSILVWASLLPFFAAPSLEMAGRVSLANYEAVLARDDFSTALQNSIILAIAAPTVVMTMTAVISWIVYRSRFPAAGALDFLAFIPIAIPGLVLGTALIGFYVAFPIPIYGTLLILLIAYTTKFLPFGMRAATGSMAQIHRELEDAAHMSGATWWQTFRRVTFPLLRPGLAAGWVYISIISIKEFSASILLASNDSTVLSLLLFELFTAGQHVQVAAVGIVMILLLLVIVVVFRALVGRIGLQV